MPEVPDIRMSAPVRQLLGPEMIQHTLAAPLARARCPVCREQVPASGPVNVVVSISGLAQAITINHPWCAPSAVMRGHGDVNLLAADDMLMAALLVPHGPALLPVLVGERKRPPTCTDRLPPASSPTLALPTP